MSNTVQQLLNGLGTPVTADGDEIIEAALDRMVRYNFSQLPVIRKNGDETQYFLITNDSILRTLSGFGVTVSEQKIHVADALIKVPRVYRPDDDLFEMIETVSLLGAALVTDNLGQLTHIVTSYDTTQYLRQWAEDIMYARDIEHALKRYITEAFLTPDGSVNEEARQQVINEILSQDKEQQKRFDKGIRRYLNKYWKDPANPDKPILPGKEEILDAYSEMIDPQEKPKLFKDLTLDGYIKLFLHDICWGRCEHVFNLSKDAVIYMLEGIRETRNKLAHFREDEITSQQRKQLRTCADWLANHDKEAKEAFLLTTEEVNKLIQQECP